MSKQVDNLPEYPSISPSEMPGIIERVAVELNEPVMIVGAFGGGKTEIAYQTAAKNDWHICDVAAGSVSEC